MTFPGGPKAEIEFYEKKCKELHARVQELEELLTHARYYVTDPNLYAAIRAALDGNKKAPSAEAEGEVLDR